MTDETNGPSGESQETTAADSTVITEVKPEGDGETWVAGLQAEDNRALVEKKQWKTPDDAVKSYRELEALASKSLRVPGEKATEEEWDAFYVKAGKPEKPEGYELKLNPEAVPENFPYDEKSAQEYKLWAHEGGLNPKQAQKLHDKFVAHQAAQFKAAQEDTLKREETAHREIVSAWGEPETPAYKENLELAGRAIHGLGLKDALVQGGIMSADGAIKNSVIATAMLKVGKELYSEDNGTAPGKPASDEKPMEERFYGSTTPIKRG